MAGGMRTWMVLGTLWAAPLYAQEEPAPKPDPPIQLVTDYHGVMIAVARGNI